MSPVASAYEDLVEAGELRPDDDQKRAVQALDRLAADLGRTRTAFLSRLFGRETPVPCGVYLWGGVGRGKSMLMDLAFENIAAEPKRRVHFHAFMLTVDGMIREERAKEAGDPIRPVAARIAEDARCLAFDEMVVTNTADAASRRKTRPEPNLPPEGILHSGSPHGV